MGQSEIRKEKEMITALLASPEYTTDRALIDWDSFDFVKRNHRVEKEEYEALIRAISPGGKYLIDSITDEESADAYESHPSLRNRILFLHKNVRQVNTEDKSVPR